MVNRGRGHWLAPRHVLALTLALACIALAGPTWQRVRPPFVEDRAPLVIAVDLSPSMNAIDVAPTRLARAKQKVRDLLALRAGARTALVAYTGDAHVVLPFTDDPKMLALRRRAGDRPDAGRGAEAVGGARRRRGAARPRNDAGFDPVRHRRLSGADLPAFAAHGRASENGVLALAVGTPEGGPVRTGPGRFAMTASGERVIARLDVAGLDAMADAGATVVPATLDAATSSASSAPCRRGSSRRSRRAPDALARCRLLAHVAARAACRVVVPARMDRAMVTRRRLGSRWPSCSSRRARHYGHCGRPDSPSPTCGSRRTSRGDGIPSVAVTRTRRGIFAIRCGRASPAIGPVISNVRRSRSRGVVTADGDYNLGLAQAQTGELAAALAAFERSLAARPGWREAKDNRDLVAGIIAEQREAASGRRGRRAQRRAGRDEDRRGRQARQARRRRDREARAGRDRQAWLRNVRTDPAEFLRARFAAESRSRVTKEPAR